jgi:hypothetical protein
MMPTFFERCFAALVDSSRTAPGWFAFILGYVWFKGLPLHEYIEAAMIGAFFAGLANFSGHLSGSKWALKTDKIHVTPDPAEERRWPTS